MRPSLCLLPSLLALLMMFVLLCRHSDGHATQNPERSCGALLVESSDLFAAPQAGSRDAFGPSVLFCGVSFLFFALAQHGGSAALRILFDGLGTDGQQLQDPTSSAFFNRTHFSLGGEMSIFDENRREWRACVLN